MKPPRLGATGVPVWIVAGVVYEWLQSDPGFACGSKAPAACKRSPGSGALGGNDGWHMAETCAAGTAADT